MSSILVLQTDPDARDRVRAAVALERAARVRHVVHWVSSWDELIAKAAEVVSDVAIVDPFIPATRTAPTADFISRFPRVSLLAYADFTARPAADVVALVRAGVSAVVTLGVDDDPGTIARALLGSTSGLCFDRMCEAFAERYVPPVVRILEHLVHAAIEPLTPDALAERVGQNRRSLERLLSSHRLPAPAALITWFRLLHATRLLEDPARRIESVAFSLGFGSGSSLSSTFKRYTGRSPREILRRGGVDHLTTMMLREFKGPNPPIPSAPPPHPERLRLS
jgi:AraC-like DNA-binding protein